MNIRTVCLLLVLSVYGSVATTPILGLLPTLFSAVSLSNLLPFPLALPLAMVGPLSLALPVVVGFKGATLIGLGLGFGGFTGASLAGLGAIGLKAALLNTAALKLGAVGTAAAKATVAASAASVGAKALVGAGGKAVAAAKSKVALPILAAPALKVAPVVAAAPTLKAAAPVVAQVLPKLKVIKAPAVVPLEVRGALPVDPWNAALHSGWDHSLSYLHPVYGYSYTRTAVHMRKRRETPTAQDMQSAAQYMNLTAQDMNPIALKNIFEYVSSYDPERCVLRVMCEVAAQPSLVGKQGTEVSQFMTTLPEEAAASWMPYRDAVVMGQTFSSLTRCRQHYATCSKSTEDLVDIARTRLGVPTGPAEATAQ